MKTKKILLQNNWCNCFYYQSLDIFAVTSHVTPCSLNIFISEVVGGEIARKSFDNLHSPHHKMTEYKLSQLRVFPEASAILLSNLTSTYTRHLSIVYALSLQLRYSLCLETYSHILSWCGGCYSWYGLMHFT